MGVPRDVFDPRVAFRINYSVFRHRPGICATSGAPNAGATSSFAIANAAVIASAPAKAFAGRYKGFNAGHGGPLGAQHGCHNVFIFER